MIGAIIGDIVGSKFEFNNTFDYNFDMFDKGCNYTDDTICTIAIADAILNANDGTPTDRDFKLSLQYWCRKHPHPMGAYGASFANWVNSPNPQPYDSFGNGAAMRVSPVGFAFDSSEDVMREAINSAKVSHNHVEGIIGAVTTALVIRTLRDNDDNKASALLAAEEVMTHAYGEDWAELRPVCGKFDVTCQGCVPLAFYIIENSHSFEDAIRHAIAYGGDTDTVGAIVGSMAEALYGVPDRLRDRALTYLPDEMKEVITKFYDIFCTI